MGEWNQLYSGIYASIFIRCTFSTFHLLRTVVFGTFHPLKTVVCGTFNLIKTVVNYGLNLLEDWLNIASNPKSFCYCQMEMKLFIAIGGKERVKGDHFIYSFIEVEAIINIQPSGKMAKAYQVRQIRKFILENNLFIRG